MVISLYLVATFSKLSVKYLFISSFPLKNEGTHLVSLVCNPLIEETNLLAIFELAMKKIAIGRKKSVMST